MFDRFDISLALAATAVLSIGQAAATDHDTRLAAAAAEARQAVAAIDGFYLRQGACPLPSRPDELAALQADLGDGYSLTPQGAFVAVRGIGMSEGWLYYASPAHPDRCSLWRKLGWDPALIWRRHRDGGVWLLDPGDGGAERRLRFAPPD